LAAIREAGVALACVERTARGAAAVGRGRHVLLEEGHAGVDAGIKAGPVVIGLGGRRDINVGGLGKIGSGGRGGGTQGCRRYGGKKSLHVDPLLRSVSLVPDRRVGSGSPEPLVPQFANGRKQGWKPSAGF